MEGCDGWRAVMDGGLGWVEGWDGWRAGMGGGLGWVEGCDGWRCDNCYRPTCRISEGVHTGTMCYLGVFALALCM